MSRSKKNEFHNHTNYTKVISQRYMTLVFYETKFQMCENFNQCELSWQNGYALAMQL